MSNVESIQHNHIAESCTILYYYLQCMVLCFGYVEAAIYIHTHTHNQKKSKETPLNLIGIRI